MQAGALHAEPLLAVSALGLPLGMLYGVLISRALKNRIKVFEARPKDRLLRFKEC